MKGFYMDENNPSTTVPETEPTGTPAPESQENVSPQSQSLKDTINATVGRNYASDEEALKAVQETYKYVSKKMEPKVVEKIPQDILSKVEMLEKRDRERDFFEQHSDLKDYRDVLTQFGDPEQALKNPAVKSMIEKVQAYEQSEKSKSVLNSNRIQAPPSEDYKSAFDKAKATGDWVTFLKEQKGLETVKE